jgi:hypothetical protein
MGSVRSAEFLARCLHLAKLDGDLVQDVLGLCELGSITADTLCGEEISAKYVADKLFLMADEARRVLEVCRAQVALARSGAGEMRRREDLDATIATPPDQGPRHRPQPLEDRACTPQPLGIQIPLFRSIGTPARGHSPPEATPSRAHSPWLCPCACRRRGRR